MIDFPELYHDSLTIVAIAGGFDPLHEEHIAHIEEALKLGHVIVILARDDQLEAKKGYRLLPYATRKAILEWGLKGRGEVVENIDKGITCQESLGYYKPNIGTNIFAKGGNAWTKGNLPELETCKRLGIEVRFGIGVDKSSRSSSGFMERIIQMAKRGEL